VRRAREILPWVQDSDVLLDLHSMTFPAPALGLVGLASKNVDFARQVAYPELLVTVARPRLAAYARLREASTSRCTSRCWILRSAEIR
jgi:hypothetical protein